MLQRAAIKKFSLNVLTITSFSGIILYQLSEFSHNFYLRASFRLSARLNLCKPYAFTFSAHICIAAQLALDGAQFLTAENGITIIVKSRVFLNTLGYAMPMQQ